MINKPKVRNNIGFYVVIWCLSTYWGGGKGQLIAPSMWPWLKSFSFRTSRIIRSLFPSFFAFSRVSANFSAVIVAWIPRGRRITPKSDILRGFWITGKLLSIQLLLLEPISFQSNRATERRGLLSILQLDMDNRPGKKLFYFGISSILLLNINNDLLSRSIKIYTWSFIDSFLTPGVLEVKTLFPHLSDAIIEVITNHPLSNTKTKNSILMIERFLSLLLGHLQTRPLPCWFFRLNNRKL